MSASFTNNARAECTMNEKFSILQEAIRTETGSAVQKILNSLRIQ